MGLYEAAMRPLLFRADPETVHEAAFALLERGLVKAHHFCDLILEHEFFGIRFPNPLGLAAGFDKNARAVPHWHKLGFGFAEIGTVTWHAQPGNPKPRLFRLPDDKALINRMGFNNDGAEAVAERLSKLKSQIPLGINLGKSKVTALEEAPGDYQNSFRALQQYGAYFVINVSSPNTPGLRTLQDKGPLQEIISAIRSVDGAKPLFVKVSPDLEPNALDDLVEVALEQALTGIIATNTTISREQIPTGRKNREETGGLSGMPVWEASNAVLRHLYRACGKELTLIGVGGIFNGRDLYEKIAYGAHLCQLYTGWIYGGPNTVPKCLEELVGLMQRDGVKSLAELRGSKA